MKCCTQAKHQVGTGKVSFYMASGSIDTWYFREIKQFKMKVARGELIELLVVGDVEQTYIMPAAKNRNIVTDMLMAFEQYKYNDRNEVCGMSFKEMMREFI